MELLASLPAIVALVGARDFSQSMAPMSIEKHDWIEFFLACLRCTADSNYCSFTEAQKQSVSDFLKLYVAVNA